MDINLLKYIYKSQVVMSKNSHKIIVYCGSDQKLLELQHALGRWYDSNGR